MNFRFLRHPFVMLQTVPAGIALAIGALSLIVAYGETYFGTDSIDPFLQLLAPETARTILSVIAGGAMSALTLTYSIVLVVFALAAGNLAPRMLKRFTSDIVNQVTAGIFGGTFLYAILAITFVEPDFVPNLTILGAEVLATLCVMQLIYFVRNVSESVAIDDEIAGITRNLKTALDDRNKSRGKEERKERKKAVEKVDDFVFDITAGKPGYLGTLNEDKLTEIATKAEVTLEIQKPRGAYTLGEEVMVKATKELDEETVDSIQKHIFIQPSRSEDSPIEFSVNLLLEIALRALSPGVNDTFTAIATVDGISDALSQAETQEAATASIHKDEEGHIRLMVPQLSIGNLINQAFHPLRQASGGNILMAICIARAYARLCATCGKEVQDILKDHALLLIREIEKGGHLPEDIVSVIDVLPPAFRKANRERRKDAKDE
ncbi:DUF2254 domain-containing protein [uncultured Sneathiella sp.]|uniref:DUF2254 domain-containing protein n=1 Tax=uncultured Sneathiella sp. TaxID=879315 RepID=UPI0030EBE008|tara:strand:- start:34475 stop:35779 length:1305 start_codon:yes stop_codon:yes gene_type:complete